MEATNNNSRLNRADKILSVAAAGEFEGLDRRARDEIGRFVEKLVER